MLYLKILEKDKLQQSIGKNGWSFRNFNRPISGKDYLHLPTRNTWYRNVGWFHFVLPLMGSRSQVLKESVIMGKKNKTCQNFQYQQNLARNLNDGPFLRMCCCVSFWYPKNTMDQVSSTFNYFFYTLPMYFVVLSGLEHFFPFFSPSQNA